MSKHTNKGNNYDKIFKENAESIFLSLLKVVYHFDIKSYRPLTEKFQSTIEREVDFLYEVKNAKGEEFILHIEFQNKMNDQMLHRMEEYHGLIRNKYKKRIEHLTIYGGEGNINVRTQLKKEEIFRGYKLIQLKELNTQELLSSQIPEVVLLAILSDYPKKQAEALLRLIVQRLKKVSTDKIALGKYLKQLTILSRLRNLETQTIKTVKSMPLHYDIETSYLYNLGIQKGEDNYKKLLKDLEQKSQEEKKENIRNLLKLGALSQKQIAQALKVSLYLVQKVKREMD